MNNLSVQNGTECGMHYCKKTFDISGRQIVNNFKCNQKKFSTSDMWNIERNKKQFAIRSGM